MHVLLWGSLMMTPQQISTLFCKKDCIRTWGQEGTELQPESKVQRSLWASICKPAVSTMLIHFRWMRSIYYMSGRVWWMGSQVFPCIISVPSPTGDLYSCVYGVTRLKPKGKLFISFPFFFFVCVLVWFLALSFGQMDPILLLLWQIFFKCSLLIVTAKTWSHWVLSFIQHLTSSIVMGAHMHTVHICKSNPYLLIITGIELFWVVNF